MGIFKSDEEKLIKFIEICYTDGILKIAKNNPSAWENCLRSLTNYQGNIEGLISKFLADAKIYCGNLSYNNHSIWENYNHKRVFCAQSAYKLALATPNVSVSTRKLLYCLKKDTLDNENRWKLIRSLADDGEEWAETVIASFFVISTNLDDSLFPATELDYGALITKKVILHVLEKYSSIYISQIESIDSSLYSIPYHEIEKKLAQLGEYYGINNEIAEAIVILYGYGHICLKSNTDSELALRAINLAEQLKKKINELKREYSNDYFKDSIDYSYIWGGKLKVHNLICQISNIELAELEYCAGVKGELFAETMADYKKVLDHYKTAANLGNPNAMFSLAKTYYSGLNIAQKNELNAKYWLKKAIDADVVEALQFLEEHPELKDDGVKNISYHADGDIFQGNVGVHATGNAVVNRAIVDADTTTFEAHEYKFCVYCGEKLPKKAKFCSSCGAKQE